MQRTIRILSLVIGVVFAIPLILSGIGVPMNASPAYWLTSLLGTVAGTGAFGSTFVPFSKLFGSKDKVVMTEIVDKSNPVNKPEEKEPTKTELQDKDTKFLYYLSERANILGDKTAVALCRELQDRFFCLHHSIDPNEDANEKVNSPSVPNPTS